MKCPKCRTENNDAAHFCSNCASSLNSSALASFTRTLETTADELARGTVFAGRYEIIEELGAGGMGRVYRVHDTKLNEEVALKLIRTEIGADMRTVERFHNEIKIARRISHKNICRIHDFHEDGKTLYLTMEYVRGEDLKSLIHRTKALTVGASLAIAHQIAEGLAEAHKLGIVHRDLKPGNIMIDKEGQAKIMDFGIARATWEKGITGEGAIIGTPEYMSPEQVEGKEADQRADIYALGAILFEMVTGRVPFEGDTPLSIAHKHRYDPPPIPKKLVPQMPEGLNKLILRCLEKDKTKRYQTAEDLIADLTAVEESLPTAERVAPKRKTFTPHQITVKLTPRKLIIPVTAVFVLATTGFLIWRYIIPKPVPPITSAKPILAVLYFKNNSGDPTLDLWKENLPVLLTGGLNQSRYLRVLDDSQVYGTLKKLNLLNSDKFTPDELKNIAADGGANYLLSGNYLGAGGKFIVNLSLINAKTGAVINSIQTEAPNKEAIFESVDSLVKKVKMALNIPEQNVDESTYRMVGDYYTRNPKALQYYIEGEKAHQSYDYDKAISALEKAVDLDPEFAMANRMLGQVYGNFSDFAKQYKYFREAYALRDKLPEEEQLLVEGSWFTLREGTLLKAYEAFKKVVERYPDDFQGRVLKAIYSSDLDETIREDEYLIHAQNQTQSVMHWNNLASVYLYRGDYKKARETLEEGVKALPSNPEMHRMLAYHYLAENNLDAAQREYEKAAALAPGVWIYASEIANVDWAKEDADKALQIIDEILRTQSDLTVFDDNWLPQLFMIKGKFNETFALRDKVEKKPQSNTVWDRARLDSLYYWGKELLQTGYADKALEKFRTGLEYTKNEEGKLPEKDFTVLVQDRRFCLIWQICALCDLGRIDEAEILQRELESLIPSYIISWMKCQTINIPSLSAGKIALTKKDAVTATKKLEDTLLVMGGDTPLDFTDHAYIQELLGDAYQMGGRLDKAAQTFARIRDLHGGRVIWGAVYARSYYKLGKVLEQLGKKAEAHEKYAKFLDIMKDADPGLPEVEDARKRLETLSP